ncbi:MAG TPA: hypothetical protein VGA00_03340 [Acidiferrobacterales bacterium]
MAARSTIHLSMLGKLICIGGSAAVVLFPPYDFLGDVRWGFVFGSIVSAFGKGLHVHQYIDYPILLMELVLVNGVGVALFFAGIQERRRRAR